MERQAVDQTALVRELALPLYQSKVWLKFLGVMSMIQGALSALTIVGIIIAWLPIWVGVLLYQAATSIEKGQLTGDADSFVMSMSKLRTYFVIQGILTVLGLIAAGVALALGVLGVLFDYLT
jgi:hypothetical protein